VEVNSDTLAVEVIEKVGPGEILLRRNIPEAFPGSGMVSEADESTKLLGLDAECSKTMPRGSMKG